MYPVQTSFIPLSVALVKFVAEGGNAWGNYPYWYLGEVPLRYLTGPVVPVVILGLDRFFGGLSMFDWSLVLVVVAWAVAALGWGILASLLTGKKKVGLLVGMLYLVLPWHILSSLALGETSAVLASSVGPWAMLAFVGIKNGELIIKNLILAILLFAVLLLINTVASIPTILGLGILSFVLYKHPVEGLKRAGLVVFLGGLLTIWWYDSGYWLKILFAPSFGGRSVVGSLLYVVDMARTLLPVVVAFIVVVWKVKPKNNFEKFAYLWLGSFVGLTLVRFAANVHFWLDWTSWFGEIEIGLALVLAGFFGKNALLLGHSFGRDQQSVELKNHFVAGPVKGSSQPMSSTVIDRKLSQNSDVGLRALAGTPSALATRKVTHFVIIMLVVGFWFLVFANKDFWMPRKSIENMAEYKIAEWFEINSMNCEPLTVNCPTVFLSGTSAFWLNSLVNVRQVRGGADQVGLRPELARTVWDVRMGSDGQKSVDALKKMGIHYLVVHSNYSKEFYHDFENFGKFESVESLLKVYDKHGDIIYRIR